MIDLMAIKFHFPFASTAEYPSLNEISNEWIQIKSIQS